MNVLSCHLSDGCKYSLFLTRRAELHCGEASQLCVKDTMLFSLQMGERLLTPPALTLKASLACHFLVLSKMWMIFPSTEHNIHHLHSAAGLGPGRVNIMYGRGGSSWRLGWIGLNGELGSDDDSTWDNKASHRLEVDAGLHGGLPKHDDNTVYKDKKEVGREKFESRGMKFKNSDKKYGFCYKATVEYSC